LTLRSMLVQFSELVFLLHWNVKSSPSLLRPSPRSLHFEHIGALRGTPGSASPQPEPNATELPSCAPSQCEQHKDGGGGGGGMAKRARAARAPKAKSCATSCGTSSATPSTAFCAESLACWRRRRRRRRRSCLYPFFRSHTPGRRPRPPDKTGARVRRFRGCNK